MTRRDWVTRRATLLGAGGLAAAGAGLASGFGIAQATSDNPAPAKLLAAAATPPPGEDLMAEHGLLVRILLIYRHLSTAAAAGQSLQAAQLHDAALIIHDYIEGFHEELEEAYVFPRLRQHGKLADTVATLLLQHARGREQTQLILAETGGSGLLRPAATGSVITAMAAFVRMYEPHEAREDTVVFPAFRAILPASELAQLGQHFAELQRQQFGNAGFSTMVSRVAHIEQALGIYDLAQFTPANITPPAS
ncbi:MAG TPA: hemerythrin domain-containing protein [Streptosporangiaceae bacterium]|nr:hemerythrin domain-containing protein [Streptosporangiaceae bacterium]